MLKADVRKEKFQGRIGWVINSQGVGSYSSVDVEILHKDYSGAYNIQTAFLNPILMWVGDLMVMTSDKTWRPNNTLAGF